jgi:hypothetical protein
MTETRSRIFDPCSRGNMRTLKPKAVVGHLCLNNSLACSWIWPRDLSLVV